MRISADPDDPGHMNYLANRNARVFLDGIERNGVITADEEKRFIIMAVRDERGNLKIKDDMVVREKWIGNVHIEAEPLASGGIVSEPASDANAAGTHTISITLHHGPWTKIGRTFTVPSEPQLPQRAMRRTL